MLLRLRTAVSRGTGEHPSTTRRGDRPRAHRAGSIFSEKPFYGNLLAFLEAVLPPALPVQTVWRRGLTSPFLNLAIRVDYVDTNPRVRIDPVHLDHCPF